MGFILLRAHIAEADLGEDISQLDYHCESLCRLSNQGDSALVLCGFCHFCLDGCSSLFLCLFDQFPEELLQVDSHGHFLFIRGGIRREIGAEQCCEICDVIDGVSLCKQNN